MQQLTQQQIKDFKPTEEMIKATEEVFLNMAIVETIKPIVEDIQRGVLSRHNFKISSEWKEENGRVITEPKHSYLMTDEDFKVYNSECKTLENEKGLYTLNIEYCPLLVAEDDLRKAEDKLMNSFKVLTGLTSSDINMGLDTRKRFLDSTLSYMCQFVDTKKILKRRF